MKFTRVFALIAACALVCAPAFANTRNHGIGASYTLGDIDSSAGNIDFNGFTIFGTYGVTPNWGVFVSLQSMDDDENIAGFELETTQIAVQGSYNFRPNAMVRPHAKLGLARTDVEVTVDFFGTSVSASEDDIGLALGGGLEVGSDKYAFYGDVDFNTSAESTNFRTGFMFKF